MGVSEPAVHVFTPLEYATLDSGHLVIDLAAGIGFFAIALRANHIAKLLDVTIHPKAYMIMQIASSYPLLVVLMIGTFYHQKRLRTIGTDMSWRSL